MSRFADAELTGASKNNYDKYFDDPHDFITRIGAEYLGESQRKLKDGYSFVAHQDSPNAVAYTQSRRTKKGGGFDYGEKEYIYEKVKTPEPQAQKKQEPEPSPESEPVPLPPRGSTYTEDTQRYRDTRLQRPGNQAPRMGYTNDASRDAIRHGEDLNAHYVNKFIPSLEAEARLTGQEIGESGRFSLNRFIGKVPELGDPKDLFDYYSGKIQDTA